jgi:hypothetical protein
MNAITAAVGPVFGIVVVVVPVVAVWGAVGVAPVLGLALLSVGAGAGVLGCDCAGGAVAVEGDEGLEEELEPPVDFSLL